jgi:hypothetical protein
LNVLNTAVDWFQADQAVSIFTNQGLYGTFIEPFMNPSSSLYRSGGSDKGLDIKEIFTWATDPQKFQKVLEGGGAHWVTGAIPYTTKLKDLTLGKVVMLNVQQNALPAMVKIGLSGVAKKVIRKSGVTRSLNRITRSVGLQNVLRW